MKCSNTETIKVYMNACMCAARVVCVVVSCVCEIACCLLYGVLSVV
jgi:hypothetical protein